ncbi:MAG: universal stress protein [Halobacteriota archaeon]
MFRTVLVATDGSETARQAAEHGLELARRYDADVYALSVADTRFRSVLHGRRDDAQTAERKLRRVSEEAVAAVAARGETLGVSVTPTVESGSPSEIILEESDRLGADLVVLGTHGRTGVDRFLVGSVAESVVDRAPTSALTVRPADPPSPTAYGTVLVSVTSSDSTEAAVRQAVDVAHRYDATLHALGVVDARLAATTAIREALEGPSRRAVREAAVHAAERGVAVETDVRVGIPTDELLAHERTVGADLVVVSGDERTPLDRLATQAVVRRVVRRSQVPVLVARKSPARA